MTLSEENLETLKLPSDNESRTCSMVRERFGAACVLAAGILVLASTP